MHPDAGRQPRSAIISTRVRLLTDEIPSVLGPIVLAARDGRLCAVDFGDGEARMMESLEARYGAIDLAPTDDPFGFSGAIRAYLSGDLRAIDLIPIDPGGTVFQNQVWAALRRIAPGRTLSYSEVARMVGRPAAVRAVGAANGRNPISIVVPCHRLIGKDGSLTGYGGGLHRKRWLLAHEMALRDADAPVGLIATRAQ